jgi:hypothetical protein
MVSVRRDRVRGVVLALIAVLLPCGAPAQPAGAAGTERTNDDGPGFAPGGDLYSALPNLYGKRVRFSIQVAKPEDPAKSSAWQNPATRLEWGVDTSGDGSDDFAALLRWNGSRVVGEINRLTGDAPSCEGYVDAFYDGLFYAIDAPYWCVGRVRSLAAYAHLVYQDGATRSEDRSPDQGYEPTEHRTVGPGRSGYVMLGSDAAIYPFGDAKTYPQGSPAAGSDPKKPGVKAVDLELSPNHEGYWMLFSDGTTRCYGDPTGCPQATPPLPAGEQAVSLSTMGNGLYGAWIFTSRGRVFTSSYAGNYGDLSAVTLNGSIRDSVATPSGKGYFMVGSDGGIFAFGDARFEGSMGGKPLNKPVESLVPNVEGPGYWLVASDGGIFAFGGAPFRGSMGDRTLNRPVTGMVSFGNGYLMVGEDGGIFNFSDKQFYGSLGDHPPKNPITVVTALDET